MTNEQLAMKIKAGEDVADNMAQLYEQTRAFIHAIAWKYRGRAELDDLEQEGYLALYDAIDGYNPAAGCLFLTYARHWISQRMIRFIQNNTSLRLPSYLWEVMRRYQHFEQEYTTAVGIAPSDSEIQRFLGLSNKEIRQLRKALEMDKIGSLDSYVGDDKENTLGDLVVAADDVEGDILDREELRELQVILWGMVDELPEGQPEVIRARYQHGETLQQIGDRLAMTSGAVRRMESKGMHGLRKPDCLRRLRPFLPETERIYSEGMHGNGASAFNRTWTSSTERVAMKL